MTDLQTKVEKLTAALHDMGSVVIAFSGGVDSTFLLAFAHKVLGEKVCALTATSPTFPRSELEDSKRLCAMIGVPQILVESNELEIPGFAANHPDRCYLCKIELYHLCLKKAAELGFSQIADGYNVGDLGDYRPGHRAAQELEVRSPLHEAGISKEDIRILSKEMGLPTWNKQPFACLSSRFPYGTELTAQRLGMVEQCEEFLKEEGFHTFRVRFHHEIARVELGEEDIQRLFDLELRMKVDTFFRQVGFLYTALDLRGYRTGSMNEGLASI